MSVLELQYCLVRVSLSRLIHRTWFEHAFVLSTGQRCDEPAHL
jgi:hypothetical protein